MYFLNRIKDRSEQVKILNFNYTYTIEKYNVFKPEDIIHIHGELYDPKKLRKEEPIFKDIKNPPIFGFSPPQNEIDELIKLENNAFLKNIKKHNYSRTDNYEKTIDFIENRYDIPETKFNVILLGHSCAKSDFLILNEIFNSKNLHKIYEIYYKGSDNYVDKVTNIHRIMNNVESETKVASFPNVIEMPCINRDIPFSNEEKEIIENMFYNP